MPSDEADHGDAVLFSQAAADRKLEAIGVSVSGKRADPTRKLTWTSEGWMVRRALSRSEEPADVKSRVVDCGGVSDRDGE